MTRRLGISLLLATTAILVVQLGVTLATAEPRWWAFGGGGGHNSTSTNYRLSSTIGQAGPIGISTNASQRLEAGLWYALADQDGDGALDIAEAGACMTTPNWWESPGAATDPDCDGFTTADETRLGTNPNDPCADTSAVNDEDPDDKWPADFTDNQFVNTLDLVVYATSLNTTLGHPQFVARADLNGNDAINTLDLVPYVYMLNRSCVPPP
jgi:hypothetical protein